MTVSQRYRYVIIAFSGVLLLSSVGIPVVVVVCDMGTQVLTEACGKRCLLYQSAGESIRGVPCSVECFFVRGNTTASLPPRPQVESAGLNLLLVLPVTTILIPFSKSSQPSPDESPPFTPENITLLVSSLLI
jgi:hypothetical protein